MIGFDRWAEIHGRARRGETKPKMARELGLDRKTGRRLLVQERPVPSQRTITRPSLVTPYLDYLQRRVTAVDDNACRLFQELKGQGYAGGSEMVKLAVRPRRAERDRLAQATLRFETAPGRQAQVDWGRTWAQVGAQRGRIQLLVMVLGDARRLSVEWTRDQTLGSLLTCHQQACDGFGGLTEESLYDHPPTVVVKRDWEGRAIAWHPQCWDVAQYDGCTPRLCRPSRAQTKGQVASGIKDRQMPFRPGPTVSHLGRPAPHGAGVGADGRRSAPPWDHLPPTGRGVSGGAVAAPSRPPAVPPPHRAVPAGGQRWLGHAGDHSRLRATG